MLRTVTKWIDDRTGLVSAIDYFLEEDIPASAGWHQVFGSVAMFAFLLQVVTGILMALNYAPTPGEAWESLRYIVTQVTAGSIIRALHHWGASAMIIVVVLHMAQTFLWGAYKKPREATWILGVVLLLLTLAFGLSGYLLSWDNRAYWATKVTTRITSLAPGGSILLRLLGTDGSFTIGRLTFARFYAAHVTLLPLIMGLLILCHVILVRKHGVTPALGDEHRPKKKFFPEQVFKDTVAIFLWCVGLACMVAFVKVPLGHVADPTDTSVTPRPEWYFLFLFQMLKVFEGPLEFFGAIVLPGLAMAALVLMPFIDRSKLVRIRQRTGAIALTALVAIGWTALTATAVATTPRQIDDESLDEPQAWQLIPAAQLAGIGAFRAGHCASCHVLGRSSAGPDLLKAASTRPSDWLMDHFRKPTPDAPESDLPTAQLRALVQLTTKRDDNGIEAWQNAPAGPVQGAILYQANQCSSCHMLNGEGAKVGPPINGLKARHDRVWVQGHFGDPEKFTPGSSMPAFDFLSDPDLATLTDYVLAIPK
jgi:ubiquinol-cytochrome c reductase cytochrome b subunit